MSGYVSLYVTCSNRAEARNIAHTLLGEKLIACGNITENVTSLYRWGGSLEESHETTLLVKTRADKSSEVIARIKQLHRYDCPCIVAWPIVDAYEPYLRWIDEQLV